MPQNPDYSQLFQLMQSPAGQQLAALLQKGDPAQLQTAAQAASSGDYQKALGSLSALLEDPQVQVLLRQLGGKP